MRGLEGTGLTAGADLDVGQRPLAGVRETGWDAIVVGAGPAGAIAAIHLAAGGHRVLLVDRARFPRDKTCGDCLLPDALGCLARVGLEAAIRAAACAIGRLAVVGPSGVDCELPGTYLTLRRRALDLRLVREAVRRGATFACGEVTEVAEGSDSVACAARECPRPLRASFAVVATGTRVGLLNGPGGAVAKPPNAAAVRAYFQSSVHLERIVLYYARPILPGYAWVAPLGEGLYNVGCGIIRQGRGWTRNLREAFRAITADFPEAGEVFRQGEMVSPLRGAPLRAGLAGARPVCGTRVVAVGDAIAATLPFSGEGVGKAMETGERAAAAVGAALASGDTGRLRDFEAWVDLRLRPRYRPYERAQSRLRHGALIDFVVGRVRRSRYLREAFAGIYAETADPREVFSLRAIARSFWK